MPSKNSGSPARASWTMTTPSSGTSVPIPPRPLRRSWACPEQGRESIVVLCMDSNFVLFCKYLRLFAPLKCTSHLTVPCCVRRRGRRAGRGQDGRASERSFAGDADPATPQHPQCSLPRQRERQRRRPGPFRARQVVQAASQAVVYLLVHRRNGRRYVGSTTDLRRRHKIKEASAALAMRSDGYLRSTTT